MSRLKLFFYFFTLITSFLTLTACHQPPVPKSSFNICFTPGSQCVQDVINSINLAQKSILIQTNAITSPTIMDALIAAKQRKVSVNIILDKVQLKQPVNLKPLVSQDIPIWIDTEPKVANSKILIIDKNTVITGSFNFSLNNQENNAANLLIIKDANLAMTYLKNWQDRQKVSTDLIQYINANKPKMTNKQKPKTKKLLVKR